MQLRAPNQSFRFMLKLLVFFVIFVRCQTCNHLNTYSFFYTLEALDNVQSCELTTCYCDFVSLNSDALSCFAFKGFLF